MVFSISVVCCTVTFVSFWSRNSFKPEIFNEKYFLHHPYNLFPTWSITSTVSGMWHLRLPLINIDNEKMRFYTTYQEVLGIFRIVNDALHEKVGRRRSWINQRGKRWGRSRKLTFIFESPEAEIPNKEWYKVCLLTSRELQVIFCSFFCQLRHFGCSGLGMFYNKAFTHSSELN